jgi:putative transposase
MSHAEPPKALPSGGHDHFITFSCHHRAPYLNDDRARIVFEETLEKLRQRHQFFLYGYVLMPEHVHLLLSEPRLQPLATTLSVLKGETSKILKGERTQFWQTRYYDFNVLTQQKYLEKISYIHRNPIERGLVDRAENWPWSSSCHYLTGEPGRIEIESSGPTVAANAPTQYSNRQILRVPHSCATSSRMGGVSTVCRYDDSCRAT